MSDAPYDREAIWRRARARAEAMGHHRPQEPADAERAALPTENVFALRGLLHTNRLTPEQASAARKYLAQVTIAARNSDLPNTPPDGQLPGGDAA